MKRKLSLVVGVAGTVAALLVPGVARADGTGDFCEDNSNVCLSMNGVGGDYVYGKSPSTGSEQQSQVAGYTGCTHNGQPSEYVQSVHHGDSTNCPFTRVNLDDEFDGDEIVRILNTASSEYTQWYNGIDPYVDQASQGQFGEEFIKIPGLVYVNVASSDNVNTPEYLCASINPNQRMFLASSQTGCTDWHFQ